ncbi:hypothetical protein NKG94_20300 [Micromonospora sp. M12]
MRRPGSRRSGGGRGGRGDTRRPAALTRHGAQRWLLAGTLLAGVLVAVAMVAAAAPADRTFAEVSGAVQSLMSVLTPLFGILLVRDLRRAPVDVPLLPSVLAVGLPAVVVGVVGC